MCHLGLHLALIPLVLPPHHPSCPPLLLTLCPPHEPLLTAICLGTVSLETSDTSPIAEWWVPQAMISWCDYNM